MSHCPKCPVCPSKSLSLRARILYACVSHTPCIKSYIIIVWLHQRPRILYGGVWRHAFRPRCWKLCGFTEKTEGIRSCSHIWRIAASKVVFINRWSLTLHGHVNCPVQNDSSRRGRPSLYIWARIDELFMRKETFGFPLYTKGFLGPFR